MGMTRDIGLMVVTDSHRRVFTCSTGNVASGSTFTGTAIDRLDVAGSEFRRYLGAIPFVLYSENAGATTTGDRRVSVTYHLEHAASSGGTYAILANAATSGDRARNHFSTAQTTLMVSWSTGALKAETYPQVYDLRGAERWLRVMTNITKPLVATSTGDGTADWLYFDVGLRFLAADEEPFARQTTGDQSTSESTST